MQLNQLHCFMEAAKYHSISVAAEQNYISQSSFSSSISRLEKELGASLFKRSHTGITLTEYGKYVLTQAEIIFDAQDKILEAAGHDRLSGKISIACIPDIYHMILPSRILDYSYPFSNVNLTVTSGESREIAKSISSGYTDIGIVICGTYLKNFKDISYSPLFRDEYRLYVGEQSSLWNRESVTLKEIKKLNYISYRDEFRKENGGITELFRKCDFPDIALSSDDHTFIKETIMLSDYVSFLPRLMTENSLLAGACRIKGIPVSDYDLTFETGYIRNCRFRTSNAEKITIEVIKKTISNTLKKSCQN